MHTFTNYQSNVPGCGHHRSAHAYVTDAGDVAISVCVAAMGPKSQVVGPLVEPRLVLTAAEMDSLVAWWSEHRVAPTPVPSVNPVTK